LGTRYVAAHTILNLGRSPFGKRCGAIRNAFFEVILFTFAKVCEFTGFMIAELIQQVPAVRIR
jgi:hypothetical protein